MRRAANMQRVLRTVCALLAAAPMICAAAPREPGAEEAARQAVTRAVETRPGFAMTVEQKLLYPKLVDGVGSASPRVQKLSAAASSSQLAQTAPLLPLTWIDDETFIEGIAVGDVTGDSRTDIVAFGWQPSPNNTK